MNFMKKLLAVSIWGSETIPAEEWPFRNLKRIVFPVIDVLFFVAGLAAVNYGVQALNGFFPGPMVVLFSSLFCFAALICFIGIALPFLWPLEMLGKSILTGLMAGYIMTAIFDTVLMGRDHVFDIVIAAIAITPVLWRISLLGAEWQVRRLQDIKFGG